MLMTSSRACRRVGRRLQHYLDGVETGRGLSREEIAAHLEACRRCGLEADTYRAVKASLETSAEPVPAATLDRLRSFGRSLTD